MDNMSNEQLVDFLNDLIEEQENNLQALRSMLRIANPSEKDKKYMDSNLEINGIHLKEEILKSLREHGFDLYLYPGCSYEKLEDFLNLCLGWESNAMKLLPSDKTKKTKKI